MATPALVYLPRKGDRLGQGKQVGEIFPALLQWQIGGNYNEKLSPSFLLLDSFLPNSIWSMLFTHVQKR
jgi:hypothetical protein